MSSGVIYLSPRDLIAYIVSLRRYDIIDYMVSPREVIHIGVGFEVAYLYVVASSKARTVR